MTDYLVFTLSANLGAMGEFAGHERRGSLDWPGRSSIIGLVAAAMGIRRADDFTEVEKLKTAVAIFGESEPLRDYHTIQTVPTAKARVPQSRPQAMLDAKDDLNTTITLRDYQTAPLFGVALWADGAAGDLLARVQRALLHPTFVLFLGRKSCPLSAPVAPQRTSCETPQEALSRITLPPWRVGAVAHRMAADDSIKASHYEQRQDQALDRMKWHFAPRRVAMLQVEIKPGRGT